MSLTQIRKEQIRDLTIDNSKIDENAAIAYTKLNLSSSIKASDLNTSTDTVAVAVLETKLVALWDVVKGVAVSGTSTVVTSQVQSAAKTDAPTDGTPMAKGVLLTGTGVGGAGVDNYKVQIRNGDTSDPISDNLVGPGDGGQVYAELLNNGTDFTLAYYKSDATSYSFSTAVQVEEINAVGDVGSSLQSKYFTISSPTTDYYAWYNTSGVSGSGNPAISGKTGIEIAINEGDTAGFIAKKTADALNALPAFTASVVAGTKEKSSILCKDNSGSKLDGKYFTITGTDSTGKSTTYVIWYGIETNNTAPSVSGTKIKVELTGISSASQVATATKSALDSISNTPFATTLNDTTFIAENVHIGQVINASSGTTEFFVSELVEGKDPGVMATVIGKSSGYAVPAANGSASPNFSFNLVTGGVSKIDFMFSEIYSLQEVPLMSLLNGTGFTDVVGVAGTHNHNDLYYSRTELNSGILDGRYYTETELNGGQLDSRYFTKNDLSISGAVSTNVLDARYFTESELASSASGNAGAKLIGVDGGADPTNVITASTLQGALVELKTGINNILNGNADITFTMDDAYDDGSTVTVDSTDVDFALAANKKFIVSDSADVAKFQITAGNAVNSIKVDTAGGVDIDVKKGVTINDDSGSSFTMADAGGVSAKSASGQSITLENQAQNGSVVVGDSQTAITSSGTAVDAVSVASNGGGVQIVANSDVAITATGGALKLEDKYLSSAIQLSQTGVAGLSSHFDTATSIVGAVNENVDDLYTLINTTLPSTTDGASGADKIGATGITGVIPTGGSLGAAATVQEMMEGIAMGAGGGKTFANIAAFTTSKAAATYFKAKEPVFILDTNRWVIIEAQGTGVTENTDWNYVAGTNRIIGGSQYQVHTTEAEIHSNNSIYLWGESRASLNGYNNTLEMTEVGNVLTAGTGLVNKIISDTKTQIDGGALVDINGNEVTIDGKTTITAPAGQNVSLVTTNTGEVAISSNQKVGITGGNINIDAGMGKTVAITSDTGVELSSAVNVALTGGEIDINAGTGLSVMVYSDTSFVVTGGPLASVTADVIDLNGNVDADGATMSLTGTTSTELVTGSSSVKTDATSVVAAFGTDSVFTLNTAKAQLDAKIVDVNSLGAVTVDGTALTLTGTTSVNLVGGSISASGAVDKDITLTTRGVGDVVLNAGRELRVTAAQSKFSGDVLMDSEAWLSVGNIKINSVDPSDAATISGARNGTLNTANKLTNAGFESGAGLRADAWTYSDPDEAGGKAYRIDYDKFYGSYSTRITYNNIGAAVDALTQALTGLTPATVHMVSFYVRGTINGKVSVQLPSGAAVEIIHGPQTYSTWTRVNVAVGADNTAAGNFRVILHGTGTEDYDFYIDAIMVSQGAPLLDYFSQYQSELVFTIGNNDNDRIVMRSAGDTKTSDLIRINQSTVEVLGNLLVSGTTTQVDSTVVNIADHEINLNSNVTTGSPMLDASLNVKRGNDPTVSVLWNESTDKWTLTNDGVTYGDIITTAGSSALSMQVAYDGGSDVAVGGVGHSDVTFTMAPNHKFVLADETDANKFVVMAGTGDDSVNIGTSGGVNIEATSKIDLIAHSGRNAIYTNSMNLDNGNIKAYVSSGSEGAIELNAEDSTTFVLNYEHAQLDVLGGAADSIRITTAGGIDINAGATRLVAIDTGSFSIDGVLASNVTVTGANLTVSTINSGDIDLTSAGNIVASAIEADITATNINTTGLLLQTGDSHIIGDVNLDGSFDQTGNYTFNVDSSNTAANSVRVNTLGGVDVDAAGNITIGAVKIQTAAELEHTGTSKFTGDVQVIGSLDVDGATVDLTSTGTGGTHLALVSADAASITAVGVNIEAGIGALSLEADAVSHINVTGNNLSIKTTTSGAVALDSAGAITFKDAIATTALPFSQTNAGSLSAKFAYNSQTAFNWTSRATGTDAIGSMTGAVNANRQDLWEYVELLNTQGAPIGVAAGANLIGANGINGLRPMRSGASLGDDGTVQELLEALALGAGGSCKHFTTLKDFYDYKSGGGVYIEPGYLAVHTQVYIESIEREIRVLQQGTGIVEGTDWNFLWGAARPLQGTEFIVSTTGTGASAIKLTTVGGIDLDSKVGITLSDDSGSNITMANSGDVLINSANGKELDLTSDTKVLVDGGALVDINGTSVTIDGAVAITGSTNNNVSITTSGTGKSVISSSQEIDLNGGKIALAAGANGDLVLSTAAGTGKIDINATNAFEMDAGSASYINVTGDLTLKTTTSGEIYFDDARTSAIPFSDSTHTSLPGATTSILGAIQKAYDRVGDTTFVEYAEHQVDSTDVTNDYIVTNISIMPTSGTFPMSPSTLRNISGNKVFVAVYLNGLRLVDSEWNFTYQSSERRITFDGSSNLTLVAGDQIAVEVTKIISSTFE